MFFSSIKEDTMLFPHPRTLKDHLSNVLCALAIGCFFAFVGLNAASGCGQPGGACIHIHDLVSAEPTPQLALADR
jgi:hypothetical protein